MDNQAVFSGPDFDQWAHREAERGKLTSKEEYLVARYFAREGRTLDGGTGGGRVLFALQKQGFGDLYGFDFVAQSIAAARQRDAAGQIHFDVMDATQLGYADDFFAQIIYAEHMLSFLVDDTLRAKAIREAYRVLQRGGVAIFTALALESRQSTAGYRAILHYLKMLRKLRGSRRPIQCFPWLKVGGQWNWRALADAPPYSYWFRAEELARDLQSAGFHLEAIGTDAQIRERRLCATAAELAREKMAGALYAVCRK